MKKIWLLPLFIILLVSCSNSRERTKNPNIPNYSVNLTVDTNLPLYSNLKFPSSPVYIPNYGAKGIIIMRTGEGTYNAFDAACPNQALASCKAMTVDGIMAICSCDKSKYNLYTGLGDLEYPMKQYRVDAAGNVLRIYN